MHIGALAARGKGECVGKSGRGSPLVRARPKSPLASVLPYRKTGVLRGDIIMDRRTLLAAAPAVALLPAAARAQGAAPPAPHRADPAQPPMWEKGEDRFLRPDVAP